MIEGEEQSSPLYIADNIPFSKKNGRVKGVFSKGLKENQLKAFKREHKK